MITSSSLPYSRYAGNQGNSQRTIDLGGHSQNGQITGIRVIWSDYIVGLEVSFGGKSSEHVVGSHKQGLWDENFNVVQGDYITELFGRASNRGIACIGFRTAKGLNKVWGNVFDGEPFVLALQGSHLRSLRLGVSDVLTFIEPVFEDSSFFNARKLEFSGNGKWTHELGKSKGESFDDYDWIRDKFNYEIAEVKIWHDHQHVYGIQFFYNMDGTKKTPGNHLVFANNLQADSLQLASGEHITKILVQAGDWIDGITLITDRGQTLKTGGRGGNTYLAVAPNNNHFIAVSGSTGQYLHSLVLYYDEIY